MPSSSKHVAVVIVGGGPVGLSLAIGLRHFGVDCVLVEKHASTLGFPKGRVVNPRSMEIFSQWGVADRIHAQGVEIEPATFGFLGETLLASEFRRIEFAEPLSTPMSPQEWVLCPQERVERALREAAEEADADVRFGHRFVSFTSENDSVVAHIVDARGEPIELRCDYLVAADGSRGAIGPSLGIGFEGPGVVGESISILVDAPLRERIADRVSVLYGVQRPRPGGGFAMVDNDRQWLLMLPRDVEHEPPESFTPDRCVELVAAAIGDDSVPITYLGHRLWQPTARWASAMSAGRIFLAGDAAHSTTPAGGLGMNAGVADAGNLAWKLAWVLRCQADAALLDSYDLERRPAARRSAEASLAIGAAVREPGARRSALGVTLGIEYESPTITPDGTTATRLADGIHDYEPTARPGGRAPHVRLADGASTLDMFGSEFVVVVRDDYGMTSHLQNEIGGLARVAEIPASAADAYGISGGGFVLVRPDGYVAARGRNSDASARDIVAAWHRAVGR
ncbi:MAG: FAD-dependent monooxygenase [Microthrixaceae bacterium]|nr:FAD-dependent monooxygenase [Microthrixaceae bacterium]